MFMNEIKSYADLVKYINAEMRDPGLKKLLFSTESPDVMDLNTGGIAYTVVQTAFLIAYLQWFGQSGTLDKTKFGDHAQNVFELFDTAFSVRVLCADLMVYVLDEIERDVKENCGKSFFANLFTSEDCPYSKIYDIIYAWLNGGDAPRNMLGLLVSLFKSVDMFRNVEFCVNGSKFAFIVNGNRYDASEYLCIDEYEKIYILKSYKFENYDTVNCCFMRMDDAGRTLDIVKRVGTKDNEK